MRISSHSTFLTLCILRQSPRKNIVCVFNILTGKNMPWKISGEFGITVRIIQLIIEVKIVSNMFHHHWPSTVAEQDYCCRPVVNVCMLYSGIILLDLPGYVSWFFSCYLPSGFRDVWLCPGSSNSNNNVSLASFPSGLADMKSAQTKSDLCMPRAIA